MAKKTGALKKRVVKVEPTGHAHVHSSFNNIIIRLYYN
jgi:small subunit ribosomal protein S11